ncbi:MAG: ATPase, T2SS/T4P/T4SS family, partial [Candidatus Aenigmatarchaeota archaeon]
HKMLKPLLIPELVTSKIELEPPGANELENYPLGSVKVSVFTLSDRPDRYYFVSYPEFSLNNAQLKAIHLTFKKIADVHLHMDMTPQAMRKNFARIADQTLKDFEKKDLLKEILLRHTAGYGLIEPLLADERLTDVYVDSGSRLVHVVHSKYGECITNIHLSTEDIEKLSTRLRAVSGRPFDASSPVLHAELEEFGVRVAGIREPSTYSGTGFAFRRRKTAPWTLPEFVKVKMMSPEAAGLLSFLMDGNASLLLVGPRSSGKSSLLTSLLLEINQNNRIIAIEDTPEIPVPYMRSLGFKVEHLKIEAFSKGYELSAEDALRTSLRLGESILVLGEVRGPEAKALFEAMRIGAVGNVVIGTIHGSGPYDVWDRITNDLGVPSTSFKAADIILSTGIIREGESTERQRRLFGITEVRKNWRDEPVFADLMTYSRGKDRLKASDFWKSETVRKIAAVKGLSRAQALANIDFRIRMRKALLKESKKRPELLSAEWVIAANNKYIDLMRGASKRPDYRKLFGQWQAWLKAAAK